MLSKHPIFILIAWFMVTIVAYAFKYYLVMIGSLFIFVYELLDMFYFEDPMD